MQNATISLGQINFINAFPINYVFEKWHLEDVITSNGYPTLINELFESNLLHVAPVSSIEYIKNKDKYSLIDTIIMGSNGQVGSVTLYSNYLLNELQGKNIALPYTSATSVALIKILLKENGVDLSKCTFIDHKYECSLKEALQKFDAVLYIGDPALIANNSKENNQIKKFDLGEEWKKLTGLPMVFATWVAHSKWQDAHKDKFERISLLLDKAVEAAFKIYFNEIVEQASKSTNLDKEIIRDYFTNKIVYKPTIKYFEALKLFETKYKEISE